MATKQKKSKDQQQPQQQQTSSLSISRNKHWKYISSYHGPWLQLPLELLESLYIINNDTIHNNAHVVYPASTVPPPLPRTESPYQREGEHRPLRHQPFSGTPPPPIDPIIFKNLITIRRLVDEAADLSVRAASGISGGPGGGGLLGNYGAGGRNMTMSAIRQHRMRELAVNKLALAYRIDEIATAVVTMQSASAVDEVAAKVLKKNADQLEALYVNFFHEKIPSRMLSQSTSTDVLDRIIAASPSTPEYYRTRGVVKCFKDDFPGALRDFKAALMHVKHRKRLNSVWQATVNESNGSATTKNGRDDSHHKNDEDDCTGTESQLYFLRAACFLQYAVSVIDKAIQKIEGTNGTANGIPATNAAGQDENKTARTTTVGSTPLPPPPPSSHNIEEYQKILMPHMQQIANLAKRSIRDYTHFLSFYPTSVPPMAPPLLTNDKNGGSSSAISAESSRQVSPVNSRASSPAPEKSIGVETQVDPQELSRNTAGEVSMAKSLAAIVPPVSQGLDQLSSQAASVSTQPQQQVPQQLRPPHHFATYHPLLVEAWYAIALNYLLLGDYAACASWHNRITQMHDCIEGYPVFLPARSMAQADYVEVLERLKKRLLSEASDRALSIAEEEGGENSEEFFMTEKEAINKLLGELMVNEGPNGMVTGSNWGAAYGPASAQYNATAAAIASGQYGMASAYAGYGSASTHVCTNPNHHHHQGHTGSGHTNGPGYHQLYQKPASAGLTQLNSKLLSVAAGGNPTTISNTNSSSVAAVTTHMGSHPAGSTSSAVNGDVATLSTRSKKKHTTAQHQQQNLPRQYPLFTQRADSIMTWVWAVVVPGLRFGDEEGGVEDDDAEKKEADIGEGVANPTEVNVSVERKKKKSRKGLARKEGVKMDVPNDVEKNVGNTIMDD